MWYDVGKGSWHGVRNMRTAYQDADATGKEGAPIQKRGKRKAQRTADIHKQAMCDMHSR